MPGGPTRAALGRMTFWLELHREGSPVALHGLHPSGLLGLTVRDAVPLYISRPLGTTFALRPIVHTERPTVSHRRRLGFLACATGVVAASLISISPAAGPAEPRTVRVAIKGNENNITPFTVGFGANPATNDIQHLVYDSLFWSQAKAEPEPWLADKAESTDGGKIWTVTLREGVKWQDGQPFTSDDVAFSYDYYKRQEGASGRYAHHVSDVPPFDHSEVVDARTIKLFFTAPAPQFKIMPAADLPIIARHVFENVADPAKATTTLPIGTGPFKLVQIVPDQRYILEANQQYFKGKPRIDRLEMVIIKDPGGAFTALRTGDVDMVERNVPAELVDQLKGTPGIGVAEGTRFESIQLYFNARKEPLNDPKLRKAMSMGINLEDIVKTVLLGRARPGRDTYLHPDSPWAGKDAGHQFDPAGANKLLDEAGYSATRTGCARQRTASASSSRSW